MEKTIESIKKNPDELLELLKDVAPVLYVIALLNKKYLSGMEFGEIHITEFVQRGKIIRAEGTSKTSVLVDA